MSAASKHDSAKRRVAIEVRGVVQGVGFRPFVFNLARRLKLGGWVLNEADTVRIEVQGRAADVTSFLDALQHEPPVQARIDRVDVSEQPCQESATDAFTIRASSGQASPRPTIPADLATCPECLAEIVAPTERRHRYPFTNCTNCGPRWSIIEQLPYDRPRTSMRTFAMCDACGGEYDDPTDRRFHAQPIACPACGPQLELLDRTGAHLAAGDDALVQTAETLCGGHVVALKGLGGFQLLADATSDEAVGRLRQRKRRGDKPLAVMVATLDAARRECELAETEARELASHQAPILLLRRRPSGEGAVVAAVAPGNPYLGVMLPNTPLHHLLLAAVDRPIVCTSGNLSEEPMALETDEALKRLATIADVLLTHNRPIVRQVDDSVARVGPDGLQVFRRARGFSPLPIDLGRAGPTILAVGGHLKNTVALSLGSQAVVSSHVGDLDNALSVDVHRRAVDDLLTFFQAAPDAVACDLHPDYASTRTAQRLAAQLDVPLLRVQHHHAHVAACMAEHQLDGPVVGLSWDGTGYGPDGTIWGGEVLRCDNGRFTRVAHLRTFALPGGDRAVRQPRRSALGVLFELLGAEAAQHVRASFEPSEIKTLVEMLTRGVNSPRTSSMGRLFDAVASLAGLAATIDFEGQAAMALEFAADTCRRGALLDTPAVAPERKFAADSRQSNAYSLPLSADVPAIADWGPLVHAVLADRAAGVGAATIGARFHNALAALALDAVERSGCDRVVLTGGCFQNALLTEKVRSRLLQKGVRVYLHRHVPPGDGGIALGQLHVAVRRLEG